MVGNSLGKNYDTLPHFRLAFTIAKTKTSLNSYKEFVESRRRSGLEMGNGCKGKAVAKHMTQAISDMYLKETIDLILSSNSPISLLMDGGDDGFGDHYATVIFQFIDKDKNVQVRFYRLIPLGVMSTGLAYFEAIEEALRNDGLKNHLKAHLSAIVTDNAQNMMGNNEGFSMYLKQDLDRPEAISHGCLAHKLELVLNSALKNSGICTNCNRLNFYLKKVHHFFRRSNKRKLSFGKYCQKVKRRSFRARRVMDVRWVSSHFLAAKVIFLNWDILVGWLKSIKDDPDWKKNNESNKKTKEKARLLLRCLTQRNALSTLALQLDLMYIFKGMSVYTQKSGISIAGAASKKQDVLDGIENVLREGGTFMKQLLLDAKCEGMPCLTLSAYEKVHVGEQSNYNEVRYFNELLMVSIIPDTDAKGKVTEENVKFVKTSEEIPSYINFLKQKVEEKMPSSDVLTKAGILDQTKWNFRLRSNALDPTFLEKLQNWPTIFNYDYSESEITEDFLKIVKFTEDNPTFWCANHFSDPTEFFSLLLRKMTAMPPKFKYILEMTMVTPLSNADSERSFSRMKAIKTDVRNRLSSEMLDVLLRISMYGDTFETFDVNKATAHYLRNHERCDGVQVQRSATTLATESTTALPPLLPASECTSIQGEAELELEEDMNPALANDHEQYHQPGFLGMLDPRLADHADYSREQVTGLLERKPREECFAIINKVNGKALSAYGNDIGIRTFVNDQNQYWYIQNDFIVSNAQGKVIQRELIKGQPVKLSPINHDNERQKWKIVDHNLNMHFIESKTQQVQLDVLGTVYDEGSRVGASKKAEVSTQVWTFEKMASFYPLSISNPTTQMTTSPQPEPLTRNPLNFLFSFTNQQSNKALSIDENEIVVKRFRNLESQKWFRQDYWIASNENGLVLQATEEDEAVVLAPHNPNEIKQKWTFELNSDGTSTIKSLFNELTLSQIVDSYRNDKVSIGTKAALGQDKQKWSLSIVY